MLLHSPGTGMYTFPSAGTLPRPVLVCVWESHLRIMACCALTHLERELSALRNVDINQSHREWWRFKFRHRIIPPAPKCTRTQTRFKCTAYTESLI